MKSILIIVPYQDIYPPMNGGMQRCFHIIHQLAKYFDLAVIIHQDKENFQKASEEYPAFKNITIYSTKDEPGSIDIFTWLPKKFANSLRYRWIKKQLRNSADGSFLKYYPLLVRLLKQKTYDAIILENLNTLNAVSVIRKLDKTVSIIYDAHNVDSLLSTGTPHQKGIIKVESNLYKKVNAIFTCSERDRKEFLKMNHNRLPVAVIPNGVAVSDELYNKEVNEAEPESIIFCGAMWTHPNQEGLLWFYDKIWPTVKKSLPQLKLLVVGSGTPPQSFQLLLKDCSLQFTGAVGDVKPWYNKATVAIVPLLSGSGTRLKILEAMSLGVPVISTAKGAEGIDYTDGKDILIADKENEFASRLVTLLQNRHQRIGIGNAARKLVEAKYAWDEIGKSLNKYISFQLPAID